MRFRVMKEVWVALMSLAMCCRAQAGLEWDKVKHEFEATPEDVRVEVAFAFKNTGAQPVSITRVHTACNCTTAAAAVRQYAPGDSGTLDVKFEFGGRMGPQRKEIKVTTSDGAIHKLELTGWIRQPLTIAPSLLFWRIGEEVAAKKAQLTLAAGKKLKIREVVSSNAQIHAEIENNAEGEPISLKVTPRSTSEPHSAEITLITESSAGKPGEYKLHVRVK